MRRRRKELINISEVIGKSAKKFGFDRQVPFQLIGKKWPELMGSSVGQHSYPVKLRGKTLILRVEHPTWMQELSFLKPQILDKIRRVLPKTLINEIRFELGDLSDFPTYEKPEQGAKNERRLNEDEIEFIERAADQICDAEIRETARRAMEMGFRRKR